LQRRGGQGQRVKVVCDAPTALLPRRLLPLLPASPAAAAAAAVAALAAVSQGRRAGFASEGRPPPRPPLLPPAAAPPPPPLRRAASPRALARPRFLFVPLVRRGGLGSPRGGRGGGGEGGGGERARERRGGGRAGEEGRRRRQLVGSETMPGSRHHGESNFPCRGERPASRTRAGVHALHPPYLLDSLIFFGKPHEERDIQTRKGERAVKN